MTAPSVDRLRAEAAYHRERLQLYRARILRSPAATSVVRLRALEQASQLAQARLRHAEESSAVPGAPPGGGPADSFRPRDD
jgi:hypothetical protein